MPDSVWKARLDERYDVWVTRTGEYRGLLFMQDTLTGQILLDGEEVALQYGARFGPDVDDVRQWEERAVEVADDRKGSDDEPPY